MATTASIVWDRKNKAVLTVCADTTAANAFIKRAQIHDGGKQNDRTLDAVTVNIQPG
jgi:hypothetical protein